MQPCNRSNIFVNLLSSLTIVIIIVIIINIIILALALALPAFGLPACYHNLEAIQDSLARWSQEYPEWIDVRLIGRSGSQDLPILMAKLSDHPAETEDEPAVLIIGQVHGEEVIGVEITLEIISLLLSNIDDDAYRARLEGCELYIIPTANPEGLEIVHSGRDVTYRKNCRDNIGDDQLRFRPGVGWDTSGVDINRNFGLHWNRGDSLLRLGGDAVYNYYRGPAPFSEPETQALAALAWQRRFLFSISYHSSRSGDNAEMVIAPWTWEGRAPPDYFTIDELEEALAGRIPNQNGAGSYAAVHTIQRTGQSPDWFYQATGCFQYMVEVGATIQPDSIILRQIIEDNLPAAWYLIDLAAGIQRLEGFGILSVTATSRQSGNPLCARIRIPDYDSPLLEPRLTCPDNGRYDYLLPAGEYEVTVLASGCESQTINQAVVSNGQRAALAVELSEKPWTSAQFAVRDAESGIPLEARMVLRDDFGKFLDIIIPNEGIEINLPEAVYNLKLSSEGYIPFCSLLEIDEHFDCEFLLYPAEVVFEENFDQERQWQRGGYAEDWGVVQAEGRSALNDSRSGEYQPGARGWILFETNIPYDSSLSYGLELIHQPYFEPGRDWGIVKIYDYRQNLYVQAASFSTYPQGWDTTYIDLNAFYWEALRIRLEINVDGAVGEDGWMIDRLRALRSARPRDVAYPDCSRPQEFSFQVYPNPFNNSAQVALILPGPEIIRLAIFDAAGRMVEILREEALAGGMHRLNVNTAKYPNGLYYLSLSRDGKMDLRKILLLR